MKVLGYIMLHYGLEYLEYVIKAIDPFCDKIMIFYTEKPSHQLVYGAKCPESKEQLRELALSSSGKVEWREVNLIGERRHRQQVFRFKAGYDLILNVDSDEVWDQDHLDQAITDASNTDSRFIGIDGFVHFYRSFNWEVKDYFRPIRFHNLKSIKNDVKEIKGRIYHFGYVQNIDIFNYKMSIHGHRKEIPQNWIVDKYINFDPLTTEKIHPCSETIWMKAEPFDKTTLPEMLKKHPYYNSEKV